MIDKLRAIAIFSTVVDQGTFRAAAKHLGLAPSRVSETVSELERDLGITLLYRSTRQLSLTHEGRVLHDKARTMLGVVESGLDAISNSAQDPTGSLRVTAPAFIAQTGLMNDFAAFLKAYPKIDMLFDFTDAPRDLIRDQFDLGIRAGWLENSDLMTRNLGTTDRMLMAHPDYVAQQGQPKHPHDMETWDWVYFAMRSNQTELTNSAGETVTVSGKSRLIVNSASALYEFAARGLGATAIPKNLATRGLDRGELVHVLPDWSLRPLGLHAVWPDQSRRESLTLLFVRFVADRQKLGDASAT